MFRLFSLASSLLLAACLSTSGPGVDAVSVPLSSQDPGLTRLGRVEVLALHRLRGDFGGLSGIAWDGDDLVAVSDGGDWLRFTVGTDGEGRPTRLGALRQGRLGGAGPGKRDSDAEEISRDGDGWLVAFERDHRVWRHGSDLSQPGRAAATPPALAGLADNDGVEAMTRLADGRLLLISEGDDRDASSPAWLENGTGWRQLSYPHHRLFRPTAAAALPDGGVLVVERQYTPVAGPAMRLVRIAAAAVADGSLAGEELARVEPPLTVDNFEAVAVRRRADGRLVATIVSDDNFNPLQSTLMLTILLP